MPDSSRLQQLNADLARIGAEVDAASADPHCGPTALADLWQRHDAIAAEQSAALTEYLEAQRAELAQLEADARKVRWRLGGEAASPAPPVRHHVGYVYIGDARAPHARRVHIDASLAGVHQTMEQAGLVAIGTTRVWSRVQEAPLLDSAEVVLIALRKLMKEPGAMCALIDAWGHVAELRAAGVRAHPTEHAGDLS